MTGRLIMATSLTYVGMLTVAAFEASEECGETCKSMWRSVVHSFEFLIGLSWGSTFKTAIRGTIEYESLDEKQQLLQFAMITTGLCMLLLPAWYWYILPKGMKDASPGHKGDRGH